MKFLILLLVAIQIQSGAWAAEPSKASVHLSDTVWEVTLVNANHPKKSAGEDSFTFKNGLFRSRILSERGFADTNYALHAPAAPKEPYIWETMQNGKAGIVFIQGEWLGDKMRGNITEILDNGQKIVDYSFVTRAHWQPDAQVKNLSISNISDKKDNVVSPETAQEVDMFSEEIKKFEKAQASALNPAR